MIDNVIVALYMIVILAAGLWSSRGVKSLHDYAISNVRYGSFFIFATLTASFIGGGFSTGNASKVFIFGIANIVALFGFSIKEIIVAKWIVPKIDNFPDAISTGDIMLKTYGKAAQIITGIFSMLLCAGILGAQVGAMGYIFNVFTGIPTYWGILIGIGLVVTYSTVGGMRAVILTDLIQFFVLAIGIPLVMLFGVAKAGGVRAVIDAAPVEHFKLITADRNLIPFISLFLTLMLGETLVPPYVQRMMIGKSSKQTARGTLWAGIFSFPFFALTGLIGLVALALNSSLDPNLAMPFVIKEALPVGLRGLVIAGVIAIVMSSADSFLNSAATAFTKDVVLPLKRKKASDSHSLFIARVATIITGILAVVFAVMIPNILDILIFAYYFWAPVILVPLAAALLGYSTNKKAFAAGCASGILGVIIWKYVLMDPGGFDGLVFGIFCNLLAFTLVNRDTSRSKK